MSATSNSQAHRTAQIGLGIGVVTTYATLVAHASATGFRAGYLRYFGVDIHHIDYWPSIAEFFGDPILSIFSILTALGLYLLIVFAVNKLFQVTRWLATKRGWKWLVGLVDEDLFGRGMTIGSLLVLLLIFSFKVPIFDSQDRGLEAARQQKNFTVLITEDGRKQALIYQNGSAGILKTYNSETKSFENSYQTIIISDQKFEAMRLIGD